MLGQMNVALPHRYTHFDSENRLPELQSNFLADQEYLRDSPFLLQIEQAFDQVDRRL